MRTRGTAKGTTVFLPDVIALRQEFKRTFTVAEMYRTFVFLPRAMRSMVDNRRNQIVDEHLVNRMQLAVTEVSGCAACSYEHTRMALRQGMSGEEIASFLSGGDDFVVPEEAKAIAFAQHFADTSGQPEKYAYDALIDAYGKKPARIMLSAVQIMLAGNMFGIPYSAFQSRRNGKPYPDSSLFYELRLLTVGIVMLPIATVHGVLRGLIGLPNECFQQEAVIESRAADLDRDN